MAAHLPGPVPAVLPSVNMTVSVVTATVLLLARVPTVIADVGAPAARHFAAVAPVGDAVTGIAEVGGWYVNRGAVAVVSLGLRGVLLFPGCSCNGENVLERSPLVGWCLGWREGGAITSIGNHNRRAMDAGANAPLGSLRV